LSRSRERKGQHGGQAGRERTPPLGVHARHYRPPDIQTGRPGPALPNPPIATCLSCRLKAQVIRLAKIPPQV
jgi:hypothetical protein